MHYAWYLLIFLISQWPWHLCLGRGKSPSNIMEAIRSCNNVLYIGAHVRKWEKQKSNGMTSQNQKFCSQRLATGCFNLRTPFPPATGILWRESLNQVAPDWKAAWKQARCFVAVLTVLHAGFFLYSNDPFLACEISFTFMDGPAHVS